MNPMIGEMRNVFTGGNIVGTGIRPEDYHCQVAERGSPEWVVSQGMLMEFDRCPHRWIAGYDSEETKQTEWGEMIDCLALCPKRWQEDFAVAPAMYESKGMKCPSCGSITDSQSCRKCGIPRKPITIEKPWDWNATPCAEWKEEHKNLKIRKAEVVTQGENAVKILYGKETTREFLECSERQVMVVSEYHDKETGIVVPVKILIDLKPFANVPDWGKCLGDLKTCQNAGRAWTRKVWEFGYHVQAAFYLDVHAAATGEDRTDFVHIVQESFPPWEPARKPLTAEFVELGRWRYQEALKRYCRCLKDNHWPGYDEEFVSPEPWMLNQ